MYCKKCGQQIEDDSKFCQSCGKPHGIVEIAKKQETKLENIFAAEGQGINPASDSIEELSLWGYYIKCFKNYVNFEDRARRSEF